MLSQNGKDGFSLRTLNQVIIIIIIIRCSIDSGDVIAKWKPLSLSHHSPLIMSLVTADYNYHDWGCLVNFFAGVEKLLAWLGIEPTTLDLSSQSSALDHLVMLSHI